MFALAMGFLLVGQPGAVSADPVTFTATGTIDSRSGSGAFLPVPDTAKAGDTFVVSWTFTAPMDSNRGCPVRC
jgi:hypothetical protein